MSDTEEVDASFPGEELSPTFLCPNEAYDADMKLDEREAKWGFSLSELQSATKVVRTLFTNPSLFVGDPYLGDSRLYTMITRDRKTKRDNRDVYKAIMNEEKSRKKRYQRFQDIEAVRRTAMKREREDALSALLKLPEAPRPLMILNHPSSTNAAVASPDDLTSSESHLLQLTGAFENLLRLERAYQRAQEATTTESCASNTPSGNGDGVSEVDETLLTISQLTAQVYRYLPHSFDSQMPPPLLYGEVPPHLPPNQQRYFLTGAKLHLAKELDGVSHLATESNEDAIHPSKLWSVDDRVEVGEVLRALPQDVIVRRSLEPMVKEVEVLRGWVSEREESSAASTDSTTVLYDTELGASSGSLLRHLELVLLEGGASSAAAELFLTTSAAHARLLAEETLNLFIARRLYKLRKLRLLGPSPVIVECRPPTSDSEEPDSWCVFQEVQRYATAHCLNEEELKLNRIAACHTCRVRYNRLHPFYYSMCHLCGEFNYNKRLMSRDLRGKVVLLTGCRIKIGYAMAVSLLRCGATVLGTTRFAHEAIARFQMEPDYAEWEARLHLFSLDLRDLWVVTQFCAFVQQKFPKLFAIINNAAQTIARTPQYTEKLRQVEMHPSPELMSALCADEAANEWHHFFLKHSAVTVGKALSIEHTGPEQQQPFLVEDGEASANQGVPSRPQPNPSAVDDAQGGVLTAINPTLLACQPVIFDRYDTQAEESDHRQTNSWVMKLAEVQGSEATEVMAINALSPFILNSKLKPCLVNRDGDADPHEGRYIINVSAMEGQFYRYKQVTHPHTNMAKAALNMMTRTSGEDYAQDGIYMNSVDTGWITDESPKLKKERRAEQYLLCPLDEVDAAARCLDLIYTGSRAFGKFYKDFKEIAW